ncbi:DUF3107 domain-containing protein [Actinomyces culturomici]|uniref:DUF3107 domain-containing protein n=1 Tax=Actinomyces culturomici TaxID=1926276 RepID=UPI000E206ECA|nr:DUF3107 domain-containing protein [Actinomyces culturomici]
MNIIIGVRGSARELSLDLDLERDDLAARVEKAVADQSVLDLVDAKGQRYLVPARSIGYVQIGEQVERRVGFAIG